MRLYDKPIDQAWAAGVRVDLLGGLRYQYFRQKLTIGPLPELGGSSDWVEPFFGGRVSLHVNDQLSVFIRGDVSGFGIGSASDLTWNIFSGIGYSFNERFSARLGYRAQGLDYERGSGLSNFGADWTLDGFIAGLVITF